jgi:hypothetical protein
MAAANATQNAWPHAPDGRFVATVTHFRQSAADRRFAPIEFEHDAGGRLKLERTVFYFP